jgi:murein DD-endopeptidase MepM/ murein hydrolase activator NlpD
MLSLRMIFAGFLMFQNIYPQKPSAPPGFSPPLDIPLYLSGNFGELRSGHFHSGLDFKTQGVTGKTVYSVDTGYISRIKIQSNGYGNSLYITHPGGLTSVYGHLERFNDTITRYVRAYQYQKKTHTIDIYPDKDLFKVSKGEAVAVSGNTGSSGGPHLHFEFRGTTSQRPLNGLLYGFNVKDNVHPQISRLYAYPLGETQPGKYAEPNSFPLKHQNDVYSLNNQDTIILKGNIGFGLETEDFLNEISNSCGVYSIELSVNDQVVYLFRIDEFSFNESSYVNAHIDYHALVDKNKKIHLLYLKPNNLLNLYPVHINNGIVRFNPGETSNVKILVKDAYGNSSELGFYVKGSAPSVMLQKQDSISYTVFNWKTPNYYENSQLGFSIPAKALYDDCVFNYARTEEGYQSIYPFTHYIGDRFTPLNKPADISFSGDLIPEQIRKKVVIAMIEDSNRISCLYSSWKGNRITAKAPRFGKFTLVVDSIAPKIVPINFIPGSNMKMHNSLILKVSDELTGISDYQGYIDDSWVLFEYDPKNELIVYTFDRERLKQGMEHKLVLNVRDAVGNEKVYQTTFVY